MQHKWTCHYQTSPWGSRLDGLQSRREGVKAIDLENTFIISWRFTAELVRSTPGAEQTGNKISSEQETLYSWWTPRQQGLWSSHSSAALLKNMLAAKWTLILNLPAFASITFLFAFATCVLRLYKSECIWFSVIQVMIWMKCVIEEYNLIEFRWKYSWWLRLSRPSRRDAMPTFLFLKACRAR